MWYLVSLFWGSLTMITIIIFRLHLRFSFAFYGQLTYVASLCSRQRDMTFVFFTLGLVEVIVRDYELTL